MRSGIKEIGERGLSGPRVSFVGTLLLLLVTSCGTAQAQIPDDDAEPSLVTPEADAAITRGLSALVLMQQEDGSFGSGIYAQNVAVTGLCGMALLSAGHTPDRGEYGVNVSRALDFVLAQAQPNGFIHEVESEAEGPMYSHGFATTFVAECYGMTRRDDIREKLERAVQLIVSSQNEEGGWRYMPVPADADVSVTASQMVALRAARNAGLFVPKATIDGGVGYLKGCQNPDGGFRYMLTGRRDSLFPRSAAALVAMHSSGLYEGREVERGREYLLRHLPDQVQGRNRAYFFYGQYYAAQAMWIAGGDPWAKWYAAARDELMRTQLPNGHWPDDNVCREYGTAMALLVLQMPNNLLPIFER